MRIWFGPRSARLARCALSFFVPLVIGVVLGHTRVSIDKARTPTSADRRRQIATIEEILRHDRGAEVRDLRAGERLVLWQPRDHAQIIWGGGRRASLFVATAAGWRHVGDVDAQSEVSHVRIAFIDKTDGVAYLVEEFEGNGYPPSRAYAVAIVGGRADTITAGAVGDVDDDGDHELRLWRRPKHSNWYPDQPLRASRWIVHRLPDGLTSSEIGLTPWIDVFEAFCSGAHPELAIEDARARVAGCAGPAALRWEGAAVVAELELALYCGDDLDPTDKFGALVLRDDGGGWRIVDARGCGN